MFRERSWTNQRQTILSTFPVGSRYDHRAEEYGGGNRDSAVTICKVFPGTGTNETRVCRNRSRTFILETRMRRSWWICNSVVLGSGSIQLLSVPEGGNCQQCSSPACSTPQGPGCGDDMIFQVGQRESRRIPQACLIIVLQVR